MIAITDMFLIILYIGLIILTIVTIILVVKAIKTLEKFDRVIDDVEIKANKLNGIFNIIDTTTDAVSTFTDTIVNNITKGLSNFFKRKEGKEDE